MAMRCSLNSWADSRTVQTVGELRTSFWVLSVLRTAVLKQVVLFGDTGLILMILWCVRARHGLTCLTVCIFLGLNMKIQFCVLLLD